MQTPDDILSFWFGEPDADGNLEERFKFWYRKDPAFDAEIKEKFEDTLKAAQAGELDDWKSSPRGVLALIILLDQFTRNMYRDTPEAFSGDAQALAIAMEGIEREFDKQLHPTERSFFYMPFMHSEDKDMYKRSIELFISLGKDGEKSLKYAHQHKDIIDKYGRYPHRNKILGRESTPEELEYLSQPGAGF